ncbi:HAMP domain-containing sensor histidine kinase [Streptomyces sp. NPDC021749]|uniref:sensor histidine kinase n=1 Tax=Streptomyces sp. NPDC021749 TaxID=3154905 RepID=UPI0033CA54B5
MRLTTRIALVMGLAMPLLVLGSGALLLRLVARDVHAEQDAHLRERAAVLLPMARGLLRTEDSGQPRKAANRERQLLDAALDVGVRLVTPGGGSSAEAGPRPAVTVSLPAAAPDPVTVRARGHAWRALSVEVGGPNPRKGPHGTLWVFSRGASGTAEVAAVQRRVLVVALIAAPLAGLLSWAIAERATRPLHRLQRRAGGLDPGTSAARLDHTPSRITEVDDLARTLQTVLSRYDEQAARTQEALATARAFAATASHELRTPLTGMQTNLDVLTDHPDLDPADRAEVLDDLRSGQQRLMDTLFALRALAQGDLVEADAFGVVDLSELVAAAVAEVERHHPGVRLTLRLTPGLVLSAWEPGLRMAVDNLLRNAVVHGSRAGRPAGIEVELRPGGRTADPVAVLTVDDAGPGIAPEERHQVFQRFHRRADSPGSGLGLTLVAQQIALHRGTVRVLDRPTGTGDPTATGVRFEVCLPRTGDPATDLPTLPLPMGRAWLSEVPAGTDPLTPHVAGTP